VEVNIIPKFLDSALTPVAKEAGERLADIVSLLFTPIVKAKAKRDKKIELFLQDLNTKVNNIPENKIKDPPLSIVGPILDSVYKYYYDEEHLRKMFASLIASSMNTDYDVHPRYINIISQLSKQDATLFTILLSDLQLTTRRFGIQYLHFLEISYNTGNDELNKSDIVGLKFYASDHRAFSMEHSLVKSFDWLYRLGLIYCSKANVSSDILAKYNVVVTGDERKLIVRSLIFQVSELGQEFAELCCENVGSKDMLEKGGCLREIIVGEDGFTAKSK